MTIVSIVFFTIIASINLFTQSEPSVKSTWIRRFSKAALMPTLIAIVFINQGPYSYWLIAALFFSWIGDVWLIGKKEWMFLGGLSSFLVGHIAYIVFFYERVSFASLPTVFYGLIPVIVWYGVILFKGVKPKGYIIVGLLLYMVAIGGMIFSAMANFYLMLDLASFMTLFGALLFGSSDSVLAFQRIRGVDTLPDSYVMFSYISGQFLIVLATL